MPGPEDYSESLLATLTPDQRACATCLGRPLVVSAGAGSGKTFMLTRRIAYALLRPDLSGVRTIDEVLAITFTELAAAEIKARVRSTLRSVGLAEEALKVDASWIGTIHGMCSRILHEHALELGLDPRFGLLDETDADALLDEAINDVLDETSLRTSTPGEAGDDDAPAGLPRAAAGFEELFAEYEASGPTSAVGAMVRQLLKAAANVPAGLDGVVLGPAATCARAIAQEVVWAMDDVDAVARKANTRADGSVKSPSGWAAKVRAAVEDAPEGRAAFERLAALDATTYERLAEVLCAFNPKFGVAGKDVKDANVAFRLRYDEACLECLAGLAAAPRDQLMRLARRAGELYERKKARACMLDQNDLLLKTLDALERNACGIREEYRDRFKMVLVDEFQDTSELQIRIVSYLDGAGHERLCTVGDAQQSIYRFRGADVGTYLAFKQEVAASGGALAQLDVNWRSHGDIITFVNRLFSQPEVFGGRDSEFIRLGFDEAHEQNNAFDLDVARIDVALVTSPRAVRGKPAPSSNDRLRVEAAAIAERFRALHDERGGHDRSWGDMVILLGAMSHADVYADALRSREVPCVIAGGSIFDSAAESQLVRDLACALANPHDDAAMGRVLAGEMFALSPDELLGLTCDEQGRTRSYWAGLVACACARAEGASAPAPAPRVTLASGVVCRAVRRSGQEAPSRVLTQAVLESGWLDRLEGQGPQGLAVAANVLKALRMAEGFEADPHAPRQMAQVAARMAAKFEAGMKEAPGALNVTGSDAVRIMTIHASKGLEFPIVALGSFYQQRVATERLTLETTPAGICLTLAGGRSCSDGERFAALRAAAKDHAEQLAKLAPQDVPPSCAEPADAGSASEFARAVRAHASAGELAEMRRKFYVGATRPREVLVIAAHPYEPSSAAKADSGLYADALLEDLRRTLSPSTDFETVPDGYEFGGERRARCTHERLARPDGEVLVCGVDVGDGQLEDIPLAEYLAAQVDACTGGADPARSPQVWVPEDVDVASLEPRAQPCNPLRAGAFSYSSLAPARLAADASDPDETRAGKRRASAAREESDAALEASRAGRSLAWTGGWADPTAFGSAFHAAAQWMAEAAAGMDAQGALPEPDDARLAALMRTWQLAPAVLGRLRAAVRRWARSEVAREAFAHPRAQAEAPLCAHLAGPSGEPLYLEGAIDLLCFDPARPACEQRAFVVDYKTGGRPDETPDEVRAKHLLQAQAYAYATIAAGFAGVDLRFVRVEQDDPAACRQPQTVRYAFDASAREELASALRAAYDAAEGDMLPRARVTFGEKVTVAPGTCHLRR